MLWYDVIWYAMIWYDMVWYDMIYDMTWYNMIWYLIFDIWYMIDMMMKSDSISSITFHI